MARKRIKQLPLVSAPVVGDVFAIDGDTSRSMPAGSAATKNISDFASSMQGERADTAVQPSDLGSAAYTDASSFASAAQGEKADTAVQPGSLGALAAKNKIAVPGDITATGTPSAATFLAGDGSWKAAGGGSGDMLKSVYDPTGKNTDAFKAQNQTYSNTTSKLSSTTTQGAIDDLAAARVNPNLCFNPCAQVWQRNLTITNMPHRTPLAVGWLFGGNNASKFTGSRVSAESRGVAYAMRVQCTTALLTLPAMTEGHIRFVVHGAEIAPYINSTIKLQFDVRSNVPGTYSVIAINEERTATYIRTYTITSADTWETKELDFPMAFRNGNWNLGDGYGLGFRWALYASPEFIAAAGAWQSGNYVAGPGQTNLAAAVGNYLDITKVTISPNKLSPFVIPKFEDVSQESLRQYRVIDCDNSGVIVATSYSVNLPSMTDVNFDMLIDRMRAPPSVAFAGTPGTDYYIQDLISGVVLTQPQELIVLQRSRDVAKFTFRYTTSDRFKTNTPYALRVGAPGGAMILDGHYG